MITIAEVYYLYFTIHNLYAIMVASCGCYIEWHFPDFFFLDLPISWSLTSATIDQDVNHLHDIFPRYTC